MLSRLQSMQMCCIQGPGSLRGSASAVLGICLQSKHNQSMQTRRPVSVFCAPMKLLLRSGAHIWARFHFFCKVYSNLCDGVIRHIKLRGYVNLTLREVYGVWAHMHRKSACTPDLIIQITKADCTSFSENLTAGHTSRDAERCT